MKGQRNRRRHSRLEIDIPAKIEHQSQIYDGCRLLNFSLGGVYLRCSNQALKSVLTQGYIPIHKRHEVCLTVAQEPLQVRANVVYFINGGMGLSFLDNNGEKLYQSLNTRATAAKEHQQRVRQPTESGELLNKLKYKTVPFLEKVLTYFFSQAQQELPPLIADTSNPQEESSLFFTLNNLEKDQEILTKGFLQLAGSGFDALRGEHGGEDRPISNQPEELALVEMKEIDAWILINEAARRVESGVSRNLFYIEAALSYLCQDNIRHDLNPIAPISLLKTFKETLDGYQFDLPITKLLIDQFHKILLSNLDGLYSDLITLLRQQKNADLEREIQEHWTIHKSPEPVGISDRPIEHLTTLNHRHGEQDKQLPAYSISKNERKEVITSLASLSQQQAATLQQQIVNLLNQESSKPVQLSAEARAAISAGEELVATLSKDPLITDELRTLLSSLKFLIIEAVIEDTNLLDNNSHPVRCLLDSVESLKPYVNTGYRTSLLRDRDSSRLAAITEAVENRRLNYVEEVTREITALHQDHRKRFESNRQLSISRCLNDEKLQQAQLATYEALSKLLLKQSISPIIDKLFRLGWINLLVQTAVREKLDGKSWHGYLQIVDLLHRLFSNDQRKHHLTDNQRQALLSLIHKGFKDYPIHREQARVFEHELRRILDSSYKSDIISQPSIEVDEAYLNHHFHGMRIHTGATEQASVDSEWLHHVNEIDLDTWLVEQDIEGRLRVLNLAWKNPQTDRYLLVDGAGYKALDEQLPQLARRFSIQRIYPMEVASQPIVERTIEAILSNTYNTFKQESAVDSLTGLSNRHAFEAELRRHINQPQRQAPAGVLVLLDLDKFQVVNDLCGFDGGDSLLQSVSDLLLSFLPNRGFLGRIGDDEFSLLLCEHDLETGYHTAEMLRIAMHENAFEWQGRMIPTSASIGVVQIYPDEQRPDKLMQAALAACNMAKQWGGNCTRIYLESDSAYQEQQQLVESLPTIKEALAKDRMVLFVQPIVPLQTSKALPHHHEILLRIRNETGELEAPQEFIHAAEAYDLMREVDRWVVEAFFREAEPYAEKLPQEQRFSINLSGKTVGDAEFKDYLTGRIKRSSLQTRHIGFEITETALVGDISDTAAAINEIRELGCSFSLDDFGSGYASFSYLRDFPVDFVKIDGVFVREILNKPADYAMINSITEIAHFMDKRVIAEFVFDEKISLALKHMGVDYGQGYHFGKPRPLKEMLIEITEAGKKHLA
jgi:diguanylate cyclase (GGDEF)-like protein